jgi:hypothetical protein
MTGLTGSDSLRGTFFNFRNSSGVIACIPNASKGVTLFVGAGVTSRSNMPYLTLWRYLKQGEVNSLLTGGETARSV